MEGFWVVCPLNRLARSPGKPANRPTGQPVHGFTLVEMMLGASVLSVVIVALVGAFMGQSFLNAQARNLTLAMNDASRVMEQIRQQNIGCTTPSAAPPAGFNNWNDWMNTEAPAGGGPKSVAQSSAAERNALEVVVVTCQDSATAAYCSTGSDPAQVGADEWLPWFAGAPTGGTQAAPITPFNPLRVTVAVGWHYRGRVIGGTAAALEFTATNIAGVPSLAVGPDSNGNGVIESQAMLTTLMTCR